jgi:hypothetical protein
MHKKGSKKCIICKRQQSAMYFRSNKPICRACMNIYYKPMSKYITREKFVRVARKVLKNAEQQKAYLEILQNPDAKHTLEIGILRFSMPPDKFSEDICYILSLYEAFYDKK